MKKAAAKKRTVKKVAKKKPGAVLPVGQMGDVPQWLEEAGAAGRMLVIISFVKDGKTFCKRFTHEFPKHQIPSALGLINSDLMAEMNSKSVAAE